MSRQNVFYKDLGEMEYQKAWDLQDQLLQQNVKLKTEFNNNPEKRGEPATSHHLMLLEHPPVYTLGKSGHEENILISDEDRESKKIAFFRTNRGGDITFHGPGQLVGYPILDLEKFYTDIGKYLRSLEQVIIDTLAFYNIRGERSQGETGVWIDPDVPGKERKICAMGVRCSRWITMHGFALNVNTDLDYFKHIVPCGIVGKNVTSIRAELGNEIAMQEVKDKVKSCFAQVFNVSLTETNEAVKNLLR